MSGVITSSRGAMLELVATLLGHLCRRRGVPSRLATGDEVEVLLGGARRHIGEVGADGLANQIAQGN
jgi:hypothetical protein